MNTLSILICFPVAMLMHHNRLTIMTGLDAPANHCPFLRTCSRKRSSYSVDRSQHHCRATVRYCYFQRATYTVMHRKRLTITVISVRSRAPVLIYVTQSGQASDASFSLVRNIRVRLVDRCRNDPRHSVRPAGLFGQLGVARQQPAEIGQSV